jgi:hypothetical protein
MSDDRDLDLYQSHEPGAEAGEPGSPAAGPSPWPVIIGILVIAGAAFAFYYFRPHATQPPPAPQAVAPAAPAPATTRGESPPLQTTLPPLDESDPAVREVLGAVSGHPLVGAWLGGEQLLRGATQVLVAVADGQPLPPSARRFAPQARFAVRASGRRVVIDPASYERYEAVGAAAATMNPATVAAAYRTLRPRLDEAFREMGMEGSVDDLVRRALRQVLAVPVVEGEVQVVPRGAVYAFADPRLEALPPSSKLLLRMGPDTVRRVQALAREFGAATGTAP